MPNDAGAKAEVGQVRRVLLGMLAGIAVTFALMEVAWSAVLLLHFGPPLSVVNVVWMIVLGALSGGAVALCSLVGGGGG